MSYSKILITLINGERSTDDILKITPSENNNTYDIEFRQNTVNNVVYANIVQRNLPSYLEQFFTSVTLDEEGARSIQIEVPSFPTIMIKTANALKYLELLQDQIESIEDNWPTEQTVSSLKKTVSRQTFNVTRNGEPFINNRRQNTHTYYDDDGDAMEVE
jgi:hypothetical protein